MHVQSCGFAENNYFFDVVVVLSCCRGGGYLSSLLLVADPGWLPPPRPRYPKDWIHHSLLYQV